MQVKQNTSFNYFNLIKENLLRTESSILEKYKLLDLLSEITGSFIIRVPNDDQPALIYCTSEYLLVCAPAIYAVVYIYNIETHEGIFVPNNSVKEPFLKSCVDVFLELKIKHESLYIKYIEQPQKSLCTHIGTKQPMHNLIQELPGVVSLLNNINIKYIFSFFEYFGNFEEILQNDTQIIRRMSNDDMFVKTCVEFLFFVKKIEHTPQQSLLDRIKDIAYNTQQSLLKPQNTNKVFLFTLRTLLRNRKANNQIEFIIESIRLLEGLYPNSIFLIDGHTRLYKSWLPASHKFILDEINMFNSIKQKLKNIYIQSLIFEDIHKYICLIRDVDFYISHIGTLQHKIGFFSNSKGLVHGGAGRADECKWYHPEHFNNTVKGFSSECYSYNNTPPTYNTDYNINIDNALLFLQNYIQTINL